MITADDANKLVEDYVNNDPWFQSIEEYIKDAATGGKSAVSITVPYEIQMRWERNMKYYSGQHRPAIISILLKLGFRVNWQTSRLEIWW